MRLVFCIPTMGARLFPFIAKGLISRGHQVDFLSLDPRIPFPDIIPSTVRVFVLNASSDDNIRTMSTTHIQQFTSSISEVRTTALLRRHIHLANTTKWHYLLVPFGHRLRKMKEAEFVASYVMKEKPDCVLPSFHELKAATFWAMRSLSKFPPMIPTIHSDVLHESRKTIDLYRRILPRSAHIITVSDGVRNGLLAQTGLSPEKVSTIYNPVVTPELDELRKEIPNHPWMANGGAPVILTAGRLVDEKDHTTPKGS